MARAQGGRVALASGAVGIAVLVATGIAFRGRLREEYWMWKLRSAIELEDTRRALRTLADLRSRVGLRHVLRRAADEAPELVGEYSMHSPYGMHVWSPVEDWHESYDRYVAFRSYSIDARGFADFVRFGAEVALDVTEDLTVRAMAVDIVGSITLFMFEADLQDPDDCLRVCGEVLKSDSPLLRATAARTLGWCLGDPEAARRMLEGLAADADPAVRAAAATSLSRLEDLEIEAAGADSG